jgi:hypothetical protein
MSKRKDYLAIITICLLAISSIVGICSFSTSHTYEFTNMYGHTVQVYGYGIYAHDTVLQAATSIGTDIAILLLVVPMFIIFYMSYSKKGDKISELRLISLYAVALYYAASAAFGLTYNRLFLVYVALFACTLFGMFMHIVKVDWQKAVKITKGMKVFLIITAMALFVAWLPDVLPTIFTGQTISMIGIYTTCITYVLDMGIISPLCMICLYLMAKKKPIGTLILAGLLMLCMVVGVMMITQTIYQVMAGIDLPIPVVITKSASFVLLAAFALYFDRKMVGDIKNERA